MAAWLPVTASVLAITGLASGWTALGNGDCSSCTTPVSSPSAITASADTYLADEGPVLSENEVYVIKFHADWCPHCKKLTPIYDAMAKQYSDKPVGFVKLDVTDKNNTEAAMKKIKELGLENIWAKNKGKNGFIMLVDAETKKSVKVLKSNTTKKQALDALGSALDG